MSTTAVLHPQIARGEGPAGSHTFFQQMLADPPRFDEPTTQSSLANTPGTREVRPGPPSPPPRRLLIPLPSLNSTLTASPNGSPTINGHRSVHDGVSRAPDGAALDGVPRVASASSSHNTIVNGDSYPGPASPSVPTPTPVRNGALPPQNGIPHTSNGTSPSRKGKEIASSPARTHSAKTAGHEPSLSPADVDLSWPLPMANLKRPAAGLFNPSMACYANATLQVLLHTPPVLRIAQAHRPEACRHKHVKGFCTLCVLHNLVDEEKHWGGRAKYMPREAHQGLPQIKKGFSKTRQEDTHEFFRFVTDGLQSTALFGLAKDLPEKVKHTTWIYRVWGGTIRSRVICLRCHKPSDTLDSFLDLSVDVNQRNKSLVGMLQGFVREDRLEGDNKYHCENCKAKANATKSFKIQQAPPVLTFQLKRFSVNFGYGGKPRADKFNQHIAFDEILDIAPYMVDLKSPGTKYRLFGVTCHRGVELRFGHYTSYVKAPNGLWYLADDEDMTSVPVREVLGDKTAYLLSYMRLSEDEAATVKTPHQTPNGVKSSPVVNGAGRIPSSPMQPPIAPRYTPGALLAASPISNATKRKRDDDDNDDTRKRPHPEPRFKPIAESQFHSKLLASSKLNGTTDDARGTSPSQSPEKRSNPNGKYTPFQPSSTFEPHPTPEDDSRFTWSSHKSQKPSNMHHPTPHDGGIAESPIYRPRHPGPASPGDDPRRSKAQRKKERKMANRQARQDRGAPMPFTQGKKEFLGLGKPGGLWSGMKSKAESAGGRSSSRL